jgi:hypothetical protein
VNTGDADQDDLLPLLLEICETFFGRTNTATRSELDRLLHEHGITAGPGWMIDMLALTRLRLQAPTPEN